MLEEYFKFPIVLVDGDNEERKQRERQDLNSILNKEDTEDQELDMVFAEAEYPFFEYLGCEDRWLPSRKSLGRALKAKFDACMVRFANAGQLLVPWNKEKFKAELVKFAEAYEVLHPSTKESKISTLTPEQYKKETDGE